VDNIDKNPGEEIIVSGAEMAVIGDETILEKSSLGSVTSRLKVVERFKDDKVVVFRYKAKKRYRVKTGHSQQKTLLEVTEISSPDIIFDEMVIAAEAVKEEKIAAKGMEKKAKAASADKGKAAVKKVQVAKEKPKTGGKSPTGAAPKKTVRKKVEKLKITSQKPGTKKQVDKKK